MPNGPEDSDICVVARGVAYRYGGAPGFTALEHLDLTVRVGETYALLGTNGAGKTTTLEILEGHLAPLQGSVTVFGTDPRDRRLTRPRIGILLQESSSPDDLTVEETVGLGGAISGRVDDVGRVLDRVGLTARAGQRMRALSGGERRRAELAVATWGSPDLIFLDEPTTGLDPEARDQLWALIGELRQDGATVVMTTHYLEEAERHASRVGLMHGGVISREGTVAELTSGFPAEIRFRASRHEGLPVPVDRVESDGTAIVRTIHLERDLSRLIDWARLNDVALGGLRTDSPTLAQVFADLSATPVGRN